MLDLFAVFSAYPSLLQEKTQLPHQPFFVSVVEKDASSVSPGACFVAYRGERADGHCGIQEALRRGAAALIIEDAAARPENCPVPCFSVNDGRAAYAALCFAAQHNPQNSLHLIGVTGTNGKTSVSTALYHILRTLGKRAAIIGTVGNEIDGTRTRSHMTTPDAKELAALLRLAADRGVRYAVLEVSSHALQQRRCFPLHFCAAVFTGLTPEHLDYHGTMERYFEAKKLLLRASDFFLCDAENPYSIRLKSDPQLGEKCYTYAEKTAADFSITDHTVAPEGTRFLLTWKKRTVCVHASLFGDFAAKNLAAAVSCAALCGFSVEAAARAAQAVRAVPGRMETISLPCPFRVLIDFAHTPDALENALRSARRLCEEEGRLLVVFGCGGDRDREKRPRMGSVAAALADEVFLTNDNSRSEDPATILAEIASGIPPAVCPHIIPDRKEAIAAAYGAAQSGDVLILCGKGHENYEITKSGIRPFSEKAILHALAAGQSKKEQQPKQ